NARLPTTVSRARHQPARYLFEVVERSTVPGERVSREVVSPLRDLLYERYFRIGKASVAQHAVDLADDALGVQGVLQHRRRYPAIETRQPRMAGRARRSIDRPMLGHRRPSSK